MLVRYQGRIRMVGTCLVLALGRLARNSRWCRDRRVELAEAPDLGWRYRRDQRKFSLGAHGGLFLVARFARVDFRTVGFFADGTSAKRSIRR